MNQLGKGQHWRWQWNDHASITQKPSCYSFSCSESLRCASWCALNIISLHLGKATIRVGLVFVLPFRKLHPLGPSAGGSAPSVASAVGGPCPLPASAQPCPPRRLASPSQHALWAVCVHPPFFIWQPTPQLHSSGHLPRLQSFLRTRTVETLAGFPPPFLFSKI